MKPLRLLVPLVGLWVVLALVGCVTDRERATADAAASIWEAADAVQKGVPGPLVVPAIKVNAAAIIKAQGLAYPPAQVAP